MRPTPPELRQRFAEALQSFVSPDWIQRYVLDERTKPQPPAPPEAAPAPDVAGDEPQGDEELPPADAPPEAAAQAPSPPDGTQAQAPQAAPPPPEAAPPPAAEPAQPPGPGAPQDPPPIDATQADPGEYADQPPGKPFMNDGTDKLRPDGTTMPEFNRYRQPGPGDKDAIERYLKKNKNPTDDDFHSFARSIGLDPRDAEAIAYKLASKAAREKAKGDEAKTEGHEPGATDYPHDPATAAAAKRYWDLARQSSQASGGIYRGKVSAPAKKGDRPPELGELEKLDREVEGAHSQLLKAARAHLKASGRSEDEAGLHAALHMPAPEKGEMAHHHTLVSGLINTSGSWDAKSWSPRQLAHLERALDHHYGRKLSISPRDHVGTTPPIHHTEGALGEADAGLRSLARTVQTSDSPDAERAFYASLHRTGRLDDHMRAASSNYIKAHRAHRAANENWLSTRMDPAHPEGASSEKTLNQAAGKLRDSETAFRKAARLAAEARGAAGAHPGLELQRGDHTAEEHLRALSALHGIHPEIEAGSKALHLTGRDTQAPTTNKFERLPAFLASMARHYNVKPSSAQNVAHHRLVHFRLPLTGAGTKTEDTQIDNEGKKSCGVFIPLPSDLARQFPPKPEDDSVPHVTVLYAGNLSPADYQTLCAVTGAVARRYQPLGLTMSALDCFETKNKQLIPHMTVSAQGWRLVDGKLVPALAALHAELREAAEKAGLKIEHDYGTDESKRSPAEKFHGHVTLAYLDPSQPYTGPTPKGSWTAIDVECWGWERVQLPLGHLVVNQPAAC